MEIFIHIDPNKRCKHQRATNPSLRVTAACQVLLVKVDNYCWDVIYLLKVTVIVNWVMFIGPICTFLPFLTACLCPVKKAEHVERRNGGGWMLVVRSQVQWSKQD